MDSNEIGSLNVSIAPEALRRIVSSGRLLELASTLSAEAAAQISAQLVEQVAAAALQPEGLKSGASASVAFIFEGGDFGTVPPRPHFGVVNLEQLAISRLQRLASGAVRDVTG